MPALFLGHGSPENAVLDNAFTRALARLGAALPRPRAILCVSAHWLTGGTAVTAMERPRTIHDFWGFPRALYDVSYGAPGDPALAERVRALVREADVALDGTWGLDHGAWSVLRHMFPEGDVPVVQLSIDIGMPPAHHAAIGRQLGALRDEGVLVVGSGNIVHNLGEVDWSGQDAPPVPWAVAFDGFVRHAIDRGDLDALIGYRERAPDARRAHPTPDHYYPLLYVAPLHVPGEGASYPFEGFHYGSLSMRAVRFG